MRHGSATGADRLDFLFVNPRGVGENRVGAEESMVLQPDSWTHATVLARENSRIALWCTQMCVPFQSIRAC